MNSTILANELENSSFRWVICLDNDTGLAKEQLTLS